MLQQRSLVQEHSRLLDLQARQKRYYDFKSRSLPGLGDTVHMRRQEGWKPAAVLSRREEPRSYNVQSPSGQIFRRNRHHLRRIQPEVFRAVDAESNPCSNDALFVAEGPEQSDPVTTNVMSKKLEYGEKVSCNLFQKVKLSYILDSLHVK